MPSRLSKRVSRRNTRYSRNSKKNLRLRKSRTSKRRVSRRRMRGGVNPNIEQSAAEWAQGQIGRLVYGNVNEVKVDHVEQLVVNIINKNDKENAIAQLNLDRTQIGSWFVRESTKHIGNLVLTVKSPNGEILNSKIVLDNNVFNLQGHQIKFKQLKPLINYYKNSKNLGQTRIPFSLTTQLTLVNDEETPPPLPPKLHTLINYKGK